jgi:hypothetical protein
MSTTGNEFEQPGVNYPDRNDADGATDTPSEGEPTRDGQPGMEGEQNEAGEVKDPAAAAGVPGAGAAEEGHGGAFPPPGDEASHQAVGVGVIDDGTGQNGYGASPQSSSPQAGAMPPVGTSAGNPQAQGGHQGQDLGRDTMTASQAQREGALGTEQEQRLPAMSQNNATEIDKISGIVAQTRQDIAGTEPERVFDVLKQRLEQSGIDLPDSDVHELARQITTGDA